MSVKLFGPKRALIMRSPFARALVAALSVLLILVFLFRSETVPVNSQFFGKNGFKSSSVHDSVRWTRIPSRAPPSSAATAHLQAKST